MDRPDSELGVQPDCGAPSHARRLRADGNGHRLCRLVQLVNEFGLGTAIVQHRDLDESQIARLGGLSVLIGVALCALSVAIAGRSASSSATGRSAGSSLS